MANSKIEVAKDFLTEIFGNGDLSEMTFTYTGCVNLLTKYAEQFKAEQKQYEGYENWNEERDCLKSEIQGYKQIINAGKQVPTNEEIEKMSEKEYPDEYTMLLGEKVNLGVYARTQFIKGFKSALQYSVGYGDLLFRFCKFLGNEGYKINGYDDNQLIKIIDLFKSQPPINK